MAADGFRPAAQGAGCVCAPGHRAALAILAKHDLIDRRVRRLCAQAHHLHDEDARTISASLDLLFLAKAIERIGDHSKNIAELIIYLVEGKDVRHQALEH